MHTAKIAGITHAYDLTEALTPSGEEAKNASKPEHAPETLVFVHGWLLSRAYWQPLVAQLRAHYRCLTYDLRGFGESASDCSDKEYRENNPPSRRVKLAQGRPLPLIDTTDNVSSERNSFLASDYSLAAYAQDLEALLDELEIENAWVLGHSLGGSVALWAAYLLPNRIKGVVCINAGGGIYIPNEFEKFRSAGQQMVKYRPAWLTQMPLLPQIFSRLLVKQPLESRWGRQRIQDFVRANKAAALGALLETTTEEAVHLLPQVVRQITQPVHFITATQDKIMPPRYVRYLASFHPQFRAAATEGSADQQSKSVSEINDCGHMAMVEQPKAVADIVRSVVGVPVTANA